MTNCARCFGAELRLGRDLSVLKLQLFHCEERLK